MGKAYKAASSVGAVALVLSGTVLAAAPLFDKWTVTNGTISSGVCSDMGADFSCGAVLSDTGFFQRMVTDTVNSLTYFQTIITENDANAATAADLDNLKFSDESFVRTGNVNGIADRQRIAETNGTTTFKASTTLNSGWAGDALKLTQKLADSADGFQTDFMFSQLGNSAASTVTAKGMKITAYVPLQGLGGNDKQNFVLLDLQGDYANVTSTPAGSVAGYSKVHLDGANGGTMEWLVDDTSGSNAGAVGDRIQAVWIGQDLSSIVGQVFGFTSYNNLTSGANDYISAFSLTGMSASSWEEAVWNRGALGNSLDTVNVSDPFSVP